MVLTLGCLGRAVRRFSVVLSPPRRMWWAQLSRVTTIFPLAWPLASVPRPSAACKRAGRRRC